MEDDHEDDLLNLICGRFPSMKLCGCTVPCKINLPKQKLQLVREGLYIGSIGMAYKKNALRKANIKGINNGGVLVHCEAGISRSASFVIAYLIFSSSGNLSYQQALDIVRKVRPIVDPNTGFADQLDYYHSTFPRNK